MLETNNIYNIACEEGVKGISDNSIDVVLTDPPYLYLNHKLDIPFDEDLIFSEWWRVVKDSGFVVMFGRGESFYRWNTKLSDLGFEFKEEIVWDKRHSTSPVLALSRQHETISIFSKNGSGVKKVRVPYLEARKYDVDKVVGDINRLSTNLGSPKRLREIKRIFEGGRVDFGCSRQVGYKITVGAGVSNADRSHTAANRIQNGLRESSIISEVRDHYTSIHPTQKPVNLLVRLLNLVCDEGALVLDCFSGSGSTAVACMKTNRDFIGFEIDEEYYNDSIQRIDQERDLFTF